MVYTDDGLFVVQELFTTSTGKAILIAKRAPITALSHRDDIEAQTIHALHNT